MSDSLTPDPGCRPGGTIVLAPHDPSWADAFAREASAVATALGDRLIVLHHIGSTAIPPIAAKPVIDMLAVVTDIDTLDAPLGCLNSLNYEALGEFGISGRRYFRKNSTAGIRTHQLHAFGEGSAAVQRHLDFRDYLRAHSREAKEYADLKETLARRYATDMDAYSNGKSEFIREVERRAVVWRRTALASRP